MGCGSLDIRRNRGFADGARQHNWCVRRGAFTYTYELTAPDTLYDDEDTLKYENVWYAMPDPKAGRVFR